MKTTDETLLDWVRKRAAGMDPRDIEPKRPDYCRAATNRVRAADAAESGEDVSEAYWPLMKRKTPSQERPGVDFSDRRGQK